MWDITCQDKGRVVTLYGIMEDITDKVIFEQTYEGTEPPGYLGCDILKPQCFAGCFSKRWSLFSYALKSGLAL